MWPTPGRVTTPMPPKRGAATLNAVAMASADCAELRESSSPRRTTAGTCRRSSTSSRLDVLERLHVPAVVLRGDEDSLSSAQSADAMATALRVAAPRLGGIGVVTLPGVGHMSANEAPELVAGALADLYARVAAS